MVLGFGLPGVPATSSAQETPAAAPRSDSLLVYIGTYTRGESKGIYLARLNLGTGELSSPELVGEVTNPTFLALHPTRPLLFAVGEIGDFAGRKTGAVSSFARDPATGKLKLLNQQPSGGPGPCHVIVDRSGRWVLVANYSGGSVACLPVQQEGDLGPATSFQQHHGSSVNPRRQKEPHAHAIHLDPANHFALVPDLGIDKIMVYRFDADLGQLEANRPPSASVPPGSGPRHLAFHPGGQYAYVINEMGSTITAFHYDAAHGTLETIETVTALPKDFQGDNTTAEIVVHPSGKYLYGSNRGHDSIAAFAIDGASGKLSLIGFQSTEGKNPRNFALTPGGRYLLAANQDSASVVVFRIDPQSGRLEPTGHKAEVPFPVCVEMLPAMKAQP